MKKCKDEANEQKVEGSKDKKEKKNYEKIIKFSISV